LVARRHAGGSLLLQRRWHACAVANVDQPHTQVSGVGRHVDRRRERQRAAGRRASSTLLCWNEVLGFALAPAVDGRDGGRV
jgi:hypothetical protein